MVRRWFGLAAMITLFPLLMFGAPQNSRDADATFTSNSELVTVPVHVTDHYGRPLHGLKKEDFNLKSDGAPERIALFEEVRTETPAPAIASAVPPPSISVAVATAPPSPPKKFSNRTSDAVPQQLYILAIDTLNTPVLMQGWARDQLVRYLQSKPVQQPIELIAITTSGIRRLHAFSTDTAALTQSLRTLDVSLSRHEGQDFLTDPLNWQGSLDTYNKLVRSLQEKQLDDANRSADAGSLTLRCFEEIAGAYAGVPGRKTVFWLTTGFPIVQEVPDAPAMLGHSPGAQRVSSILSHHELLPEFQRAFTAMTKANVVVYPIDVAGLPEDPMWDPSQPGILYIHPEYAHLQPQTLLDLAGNDRDGMQEMAHRTGGRLCTAGNALTDCMDRALAESSDYYMLGFYVSQQERKVGWHKLKVGLDVDHGEVHARNSYFLRALGAAPEQEREDELRSAMNAPVNYTGVLFSVEPGGRTKTPDASFVFKITVPPSSLVVMPGEPKFSFDIIAVPMSERGVPVGKGSRIVKLDMPADVAQKALVKGWNLIDTVPADSATTAVRVVVRDNYTGRIGSLLFPLPMQETAKR